MNVKSAFCETLPLGEIFKLRYCLDLPRLEMNSKFIVRGLSEGQIQLFNRWTLQLEHVT